MAKKVLSIEIGQQVTKAVVIDFLKKNPHVYNAFSFDTPEGVMEDGYVKDKDRMAQLLREQMKSKKKRLCSLSHLARSQVVR